MKITKNAKGEKFLNLTKAEYAALSERYSFIRNAKVVKTAQPQAPQAQPQTQSPQPPQAQAPYGAVQSLMGELKKNMGVLKQAQQTLQATYPLASALQGKLPGAAVDVKHGVVGRLRGAYSKVGEAISYLIEINGDLTKMSKSAKSRHRTVTAYGDVLDNTTPPPPGNDKNLPAFLQQVSDLYSKMFNMPGGLPDSLREQIATQIRSGLKNTQSQPGSAAPAAPGGEPGMDPDQSLDNGELGRDLETDALNPEGIVDDLNYDNGALEDGSNGMPPPEGGLGAEDVTDPNNSVANMNDDGSVSTRTPDEIDAGLDGMAPEAGAEDSSEPTFRSTKLDNSMDDTENGPSSVLETDDEDTLQTPATHRRKTPTQPTDGSFDPADDLSNVDAVHSEEYDPEESYYASTKLDPSYSVYRSGAKFANGIDFSYLSEQLKGKK